MEIKVEYDSYELIELLEAYLELIKRVVNSEK